MPQLQLVQLSIVRELVVNLFVQRFLSALQLCFLLNLQLNFLSGLVFFNPLTRNYLWSPSGFMSSNGLAFRPPVHAELEDVPLVMVVLAKSSSACNPRRMCGLGVCRLQAGQTP